MTRKNLVNIVEKFDIIRFEESLEHFSHKSIKITVTRLLLFLWLSVLCFSLFSDAGREERWVSSSSAHVCVVVVDLQASFLNVFMTVCMKWCVTVSFFLAKSRLLASKISNQFYLWSPESQSEWWTTSTDLRRSIRMSWNLFCFTVFLIDQQLQSQCRGNIQQDIGP